MNEHLLAHTTGSIDGTPTAVYKAGTSGAMHRLKRGRNVVSLALEASSESGIANIL